MRLRTVATALFVLAAGGAIGAACVPFQCPDEGREFEVEIANGTYAETPESADPAETVTATILDETVVLTVVDADGVEHTVTYEVVGSSFE